MSARRKLANAIRVLTMDAVQQANSGHPGAPMGLADVAEVLWNDFLKHNPGNPDWFDRDRFVLSNGHGSMLIYSLLHLTGYDLSMEEIKRFRQLHSKTPGHPEYGCTPGVETTTGPLGQGFANAVGMAVAEKALAARFNRSTGARSYDLVDHHTYVILGDGCMMEGISHEAASLAGVLGLGKLIAFYDDNGISIDGEVRGWFRDDTCARFAAYGWHVIPDVNGHDPEEIATAIEQAQAESDRPSLICCKTQIAFGSPNKSGKASSHGSPLGVEEVALTREALGWELGPFEIPDDVYREWNHRDMGARHESEWCALLGEYRKDYPELAAEFERRVLGELPAGWHQRIDALVRSTQDAANALATRKASQNAIEALSPLLPELIGGSADLAGSNLTLWSGTKPLTAEDADGNYIYFGVREFGMTAIMNGVALHGGFVPFDATFLIFMEYARNAVRMSALMNLHTIHIYSHDSIGQGEDGPTHQPVEQLANLRSTPNMSVWRPCDETETIIAWRCAVERTSGPTSLVLSRQGLPPQARSEEQLAAIVRGGYVLRAAPHTPEALLIATGSEVAPAVVAAELLAEQGVEVSVVSLPSADRFEAQSESYRDEVMPPAVRVRVAIEAGHPGYWHRWVSEGGEIIGLDRFGESAPGGELMKQFGFTPEHIVATVTRLLGKTNSGERSLQEAT